MSLQMKHKNYACSDLHGNYKLWRKIMDFIAPTDTLYCLGDVIDRGSDGIKILDEILEDPRVILLKGNHEDMLTICIPEFLEGDFTNLFWWAGNGGGATYEALSYKTKEQQLELVKKLKKLPTNLWFNSVNGHSIFLSHAGTDLRFTERELILKGRQDPYIWDRGHFYAPKPDMSNTYQIHGHTPVQLLSEEYLCINRTDDVLTYCDGHKIDIDLGTAWTNRAALIDLDTFEIKYFEV